MMLVWTPISIFLFTFSTTILHLSLEKALLDLTDRRGERWTFLREAEIAKLILELREAIAEASAEAIPGSAETTSETDGSTRDSTAADDANSTDEEANLNSSDKSDDDSSEGTRKHDKTAQLDEFAALLQGGVPVLCHMAKARFEENFREMYCASYLLWPLSDFLNLRYISRFCGPDFRATWDAFVGLIWNSYQATVTFRNDKNFGNILAE